jgi:hypothetical protein
MQQPVPKVTSADIRRMIRIDYPKEMRKVARDLLDKYGGQQENQRFYCGDSTETRELVVDL